MLISLTPNQIDEVLKTQLVGRIGCHVNNITYVVPISYAYSDDAIYCHSYEGLKIDMMRQNPEVCFEVDVLENLASWKSVIAWGDFEELVDKSDRDDAIKILLSRTLPLISSKTMQLGEEWPFTTTSQDDVKGILFKINVKNKTGKCELADAMSENYKGMLKILE